MPMFGMYPGAALLGQPSYFGFDGGFVGGLSPQRQATFQEYLDDLRATNERRNALAEARRQAQTQDALQNREMTLKELLGQSQIREAVRAGNLAQARLGLDWNSAAADAANRSNALSLQERLGWAAENRLSAADQAQNQRALQQLALQERLGLLPYQQMTADARGQQQLAERELAQRGELARLPYQQMTAAERADELFRRAQLAQQNELARLPYQQMTAAERGAQALQGQELALRERLGLMPYQQMTAGEREQSVLDRLRLAMQERLANLPYERPTADTQATLAQRWKEYNALSAADKQRAEQAAQDRELQRWQHSTESGSAKAARESQREMFDIGQDFDYSKHWDMKESQRLDREQRERLAKETNAISSRNMYLDFLSRLQAIPPDIHDQVMQGASREFGVPAQSPQSASERAARNMFQLLGQEAQQAALGGKVPLTAQQQSQANKAIAERWATELTAQGKPHPGMVAAALKEAERLDANNVPGAVSAKETLLTILQKAAKRREASEAYERSPFMWIGQ